MCMRLVNLRHALAAVSFRKAVEILELERVRVFTRLEEYTSRYTPLEGVSFNCPTARRRKWS